MRLGMILQQCPRLLRVWPHDEEIVHTGLSPDGGRLLVVGKNGSVRLYAVAGAGVVTFKYPGELSRAAFSPDGSRILLADAEGNVQVWDAATGLALIAPLAHGHAVADAGFSPDSRSILTAGGEQVRIWDVNTGKERFPSLRHESAVTHATFSTDGALVLALTEDGAAQTLERRHGRACRPCPAPWRQGPGRGVQSRRPSPRHGRRGAVDQGVGSGHRAGTARVYRSARCCRVARVQPRRRPAGRRYPERQCRPLGCDQWAGAGLVAVPGRWCARSPLQSGRAAPAHGRCGPYGLGSQADDQSRAADALASR